MLVVACLALPVLPGCHSARVLFFPSPRSVDHDRSPAEFAREGSAAEHDGYGLEITSVHEPSAADASFAFEVPLQASGPEAAASLATERPQRLSLITRLKRALQRVASPAALIVQPDDDALDPLHGRLPERVRGRYVDFAQWPVAAYVGSSHLSYARARPGHEPADAGAVGFTIVCLAPLDAERGFVGGVAPDGAGVIAYACLTPSSVSLELVARSHLLGVPTAMSYDAERASLLVWDADGARLWELDFDLGRGAVLASLGGDPEASELVGLLVQSDGEARTLRLIDVPVHDLGHGGVPDQVITIHDAWAADGAVDRFTRRSSGEAHEHDAWLQASRLEASVVDTVVVAPLDDLCGPRPAPRTARALPLLGVRVSLPDGRAVDLQPIGWEPQLRKLAATWPPAWRVVVEVPASIDPDAMYALERQCETLALDYELRFR